MFKLEIKFACVWQVQFLKNMQYPWKPVTYGVLCVNIEYHQILHRVFSFHSNTVLLLKIIIFKKIFYLNNEVDLFVAGRQL